ncbi:hypothetical protein GQ53DRAFT_845175 [Thozetella sp. PMI_491]|nr:hypothetical protein GQ53DRAFT_845175 [Thozetella sp. PMI_491]
MEQVTVSQPKYVSPKGMWVSKFVLRSITFIVAVSTLGLVSNLATGIVFSFLPLAFVGSPAILSICWCFAEGICITARGGHRGIHPGANVGVDLVLWLSFAALAVTVGLFGITDTNYNTTIFSASISRSSSSYRSLISASADKGKVVLGLGALLMVLHFTTFVIACYGTNVRNKLPRQKIISVTAPYDPNMMPGQQVAVDAQAIYVQRVPHDGLHPVQMQQVPPEHSQ